MLADLMFFCLVKIWRVLGGGDLECFTLHWNSKIPKTFLVVGYFKEQKKYIMGFKEYRRQNMSKNTIRGFKNHARQPSSQA